MHREGENSHRSQASFQQKNGEEDMTPAERTKIIEDRKNRNQNIKKIRRTKVIKKAAKQSPVNNDETCKTKKERANSDTE